jgi:hypothetical protein
VLPSRAVHALFDAATFALCALSAEAVRDLYQAAADATTLTPNITAAFLQQLQPKLAGMGSTVDLRMFIDLTNQVVDLLRRARADALLSLLREYAASGRIAFDGVDQDALQREVNTVLQPGVWGVYFQQTATRDHPTSDIRSFQVRGGWFCTLANHLCSHCP